ncbi:hypothetical protein [Halobacterium sp. CBA1126]|uniref:hypothetical protein n=1 Tax=Halobacterium sp. CBA1126 TaxID=2668074 RepID=UPI0012FB42B3|nr:hypothetical protein [Halobacterium sp. CBA1126]MUV59657.1 hypothetical protein [Halobacterium sp. CBA1126]
MVFSGSVHCRSPSGPKRTTATLVSKGRDAFSSTWRSVRIAYAPPSSAGATAAMPLRFADDSSYAHSVSPSAPTRRTVALAARKPVAPATTTSPPLASASEATAKRSAE